MFARIPSKTKREECSVDDGGFDFFGLFLDDGESLVDFGQTLVAERVGFGDVGCDVGVGGGEVWEEWFCKALVALVGVFEGGGAVFVVFEGCDGVGDDGVGGEVLSKC
jgi:hypothetical protein